MTTPIADSTDPLDTEPVIVFLTGLAGVVDLGLIAATALDWLDLNGGQTASVVAFVTAATALVTAALRARVYSPRTVARIRAENPL